MPTSPEQADDRKVGSKAADTECEEFDRLVATMRSLQSRAGDDKERRNQGMVPAETRAACVEERRTCR